MSDTLDTLDTLESVGAELSFGSGSDSHAEWWSTLTSFSLGLAGIAATCTCIESFGFYFRFLAFCAISMARMGL